MKKHYAGENGRYPGGRVHEESDGSLDVYDKDGVHVVSVRRGGNGQLVDVSEQKGLPGRHSLSPRGKELSEPGIHARSKSRSGEPKEDHAEHKAITEG